MLPDVSPAFLVLSHDDVKGGLWGLMQLAPLILLALASVQTFWFDHPHRPLFSYDDLLAFF
jgi:hypothetical protein